MGERQTALDFFNQGLPLSRAVSDRAGEAIILNNIGSTYNSLGEKQKALDFYNQALLLRRTVVDRAGEAATLNNIGSLYNSLGENPKALDFFNQALQLRRAIGDRLGEATTLNNIGAVYDSLGDKQRALEFYNQALPLQRAVGDREGEAATLNNFGFVYDSLGDKQKALDFFNQSLLLRRAVGSREGEAIVLDNIGKIYDSLGDKQKALDTYNQALPLWRAVGNRAGEATTLSNIGLIYDSLGESQRALGFFNQALPLSRAVGHRKGEATILNNIGFAYDTLGEIQKALDSFVQALELHRAVVNRAGESLTLDNIGRILESLGEKQKAIDIFNQALAVARMVGDREGEARTLNNIGVVYNSLGDKTKALELYYLALPLWRVIGDRAGEASSLSNIAYTERSLGRLDEAIAHSEASLQIIESLRIKIERRDLRSSYFATVQGYYEFHIDLLMQMHQQEPAKGHQAAALQISERGRARALIDSLVETRGEIRRGVDPALSAREKLAQQRLNAKAREVFKRIAGADSETQIAAVKKDIETLSEELEQVRTQIRQTSPRYGALMQPQPLTLAEIQRQALDDDTILLEYSLGKERSFLWAVTPTTINSYELPKREEIEAAAKRVHELLSDTSGVRGQGARPKAARSKEASGEYRATAIGLSRTLLGPVAGQLGKKRLLIVADGMLHYIPFGALPDPNRTEGNAGSWQPLLVEHEIVNLPSASTIGVLRRELARRKPAARTLAVLADPVFSKDDERVKLGARIAAPQTAELVPNPLNERILVHKEEKVYELDMKNKTYKVTTFEELRQRMREAREKAEKEARKRKGGGRRRSPRGSSKWTSA